jgi:preprotein translocase subunit SecG
MKKPVWIVVGVVITLMGLLFTQQGTGAMSGASMSNNKFRGAAGPVIAIAGLALAGLGVRGRSS